MGRIGWAVAICLWTMGTGWAYGGSYNDIIMGDNPVSYWPCNEGTGTTVGDASTGGNPGTFSGSILWATGRNASFGQALQFDGVSSYVNCGSKTNLAPTTAITLEAWICPSTVSGWQGIISHSWRDYLLVLYGSAIRFYGAKADGSGWAFTLESKSFAAVANTWYHVVATYDSATGVAAIYINGALSNSTTISPTLLIQQSGSTVIGSGNLQYYFRGLIDEVAVYNKVLTPAQIQTHYAGPSPTALYFSPKSGDLAGPQNITITCETPTAEIHYTMDGSDPDLSDPIVASSGTVPIDHTLTLKARAWISGTPGAIVSAAYTMPVSGGYGSVVLEDNPVSYWPCNEGSGTTVGDASTGGNPGTFSGSILWATGRNVSFGQALQFDGVSSYVNCGSKTNLTPTTAITLEAWINPASVTGWQGIISHSWRDYLLVLYGSAIRFCGAKADLSDWAFTLTSTGFTATVNTWYHVVATYDSVTGVAALYINGTLNNSMTVTSPTPLPVQTGSTVIGSGNLQYYFRGLIDEVAVYDKALALAQVQAHYAGPSLTAVYILPKNGAFAGPQNVTITCETPTADIRYTIDGRDPDLSSPSVASGQSVLIDHNLTLKVRAWIGGTPGDTKSATYTVATPAPVFSPSDRQFPEPTQITMSCPFPGEASIHYTTDNMAPTPDSPLYTGPIRVTNGMTLKAIATADNMAPSAVTSVTYIIPRPTYIQYGTDISVDGDLSDWTGVDWAPLDQVYDGNPSDIEEAYYAAKWSTNRVYLAVKVRDKAHHFTDGYDDWSTRDAVELYLHTTGSSSDFSFGHSEAAQELALGIKDSDRDAVWANLGYKMGIPASGYDYQAAGKEDGEWLYYETALTPYQYMGGFVDNLSIVSPLSSGDVIGLDVTVIGNNGAYTGMKSENGMTGKSTDYNLFGLHRLVLAGDANGDNAVSFEDFSVLQNNYGQTGMGWDHGDFNRDGAVTFADFSILQNHYGETAGAAPAAAEAVATASSVPCGAPLGLILLTVIGLGLLSLKHQS